MERGQCGRWGGEGGKGGEGGAATEHYSSLSFRSASGGGGERGGCVKGGWAVSVVRRSAGAGP